MQLLNLKQNGVPKHSSQRNRCLYLQKEAICRFKGFYTKKIIHDLKIETMATSGIITMINKN